MISKLNQWSAWKTGWRRKSRTSFRCAAAILVGAMLAGPGTAPADTFDGDLTFGDTGPVAVEQSGDDRTVNGNLFVGNGSSYTLIGRTLNAEVEDIGSISESDPDGTGTFTQLGGSNIVSGRNDSTILLGTFAGDTGIYNLNGGTVTVSGVDARLNVGHNGEGIFNHLSGNVSAFDIFIGRNGGSNGLYDLSNGTLTATDDLRVARGGIGKLLQTGENSVVTVGDDLDIALNGGSRGEYHLEGGSVVVNGGLSVGTNGDGKFFQSAGTSLRVAGSMDLGDDDSDARGEFTFDSGFLTVGSEQLGDEGTGIFNHLAGTHTVLGNVAVGQEREANGTYNMTKGVWDIGGDLSVGEDDSATGTINQNDVAAGVESKVKVAGTLYLGDDGSDSKGTYNLGRNTVLTSNEAQIGDAGTGTFNHKGSHTVTGILFIGQEEDSVGTYNLQDGALAAGTLSIGLEGKGTFIQDVATTNKISGLLALNSEDDLHTQRGGSLEADRVINRGTMQLQGGTVTLTGGDFNNIGTVELDSTKVPTITGPGNFINQGTLKTKGDTSIGMGFEFGDGGSVDVSGGTLTLKGDTGAPPTAQRFGEHKGTNTIKLGDGGSLKLADKHTFEGNVSVTGTDSESVVDIDKLVISNATNTAQFLINVGDESESNSGLKLLTGDEIKILGKGFLVNQGAMTQPCHFSSSSGSKSSATTSLTIPKAAAPKFTVAE